MNATDKGGASAQVVDVHAHFMSADLVDLVATFDDPRWPRLEAGIDAGTIMTGDKTFRPVKPPCWDVAHRIQDLDEHGVDQQVLSPIPVTLTYWARPDEAAAYARLQNDALAQAVAEGSGRFLALGGVPLQDVDLAIEEMMRAKNELGLSGLEIGTLVDGLELDDPSLLPFFEAAAQERVPIFIHPTEGATVTRRSGLPYDFGTGMHTDTSLAASALVFGGVLDKCSDLRVGLAHGCGAFPWSYPRMRYMAGGLLGQDSAALDDAVASMWVDSLVFDPAHVPLLVERFGANHIMLGSDDPFLPHSLADPRAPIEGARDAGTLSEAEADAALGANTLAFLTA